MTNELIGNDTEGGWASREGMRHYEEGNYKIAAALFSIAFEERIYTHALEYADLVIDTDSLDPGEVLTRVLDYLARRNP